MAIDLPKDAREQAIASIQRYFDANMDERIGNIAAGALLGYFLEELGPLVYNQAVRDVQANLEQRVMELDMEVREDEFQYWSRQGKRR
jgi:uncharacterized protein (DUF2164 family)